MNRKILQKASLTCSLLALLSISNQTIAGELDSSKSVDELQSIQSKHQIQTLDIGQSTLGENISGIRIGDPKAPAILVVGNMCGSLDIASEAVVSMADRIAQKEHLDYAWYFFPKPNPDAHQSYTESKGLITGNGEQVDLDRDGQFGEDPCEDLNQDGIITMMRWEDPEGAWVVNKKDDRLMSKAIASKDELGSYKLATEGVDNDADGLFNEDSKDGVVVNRNFSAQFDYFKYQNGLYPGSSPEAYAWMKFVCEHPEIAMVISLDKTETLEQFSEPEDKKIANLKKIKPSRRMIYMYGLDKKMTYTIDQLLEIANKESDQYISKVDLYQQIEKNAIESIYRSDRKIYNTLSKAYNAEMKEAGFGQKRLKAESIQNGSFEKWVYHHRGIPVLAKCIYRPTLVSNTDSLTYDAQEIAIADSLPNGYVDWTAYDHPDLGKVEIGGVNEQLLWETNQSVDAPYFSKQLDWLCASVEYLPEIKIVSAEAESLGSELYRVEVLVKNSGKMAYPLDMGVLSQRKQALIVELNSKDLTILEGKQRTKVTQLSSGEQRKLTWLVRGDKDIDVRVSAPSVHASSSTIVVK